MTREEAIRIFRKEIECLSHAKCEDCILEKVCDPAKTTPLDSEYIEAYGMAIQALSQEPICDRDCEHCTWTECPIEPCEDAVSRQDVLKTMCEFCPVYNCTSKCSSYEHMTLLPSVTQKCEKCAMNGSGSKYCDNCGQKSGKWILTIEDWNKWACSNCGYVKRTDIHVNIGWKYCPNCGAKMESEGRNNG